MAKVRREEKRKENTWKHNALKKAQDASTSTLRKSSWCKLDEEKKADTEIPSSTSKGDGGGHDPTDSKRGPTFPIKIFVQPITPKEPLTSKELLQKLYDDLMKPRVGSFLTEI